eukprot:gene24344-30668_t
MCCPLLRHLSLDHHVITTSTDTSISDESKAVSLTFLSLSNCSTLSDSALDAILCMCSGVEHLNVAGCPLLTAAVLPSLSKCTSLTSIHFSDSSFSISSICQPFVFFQCIALRHLFLSNISPSMQQATARWFSSTVAPSSTLRSILTLDISSCTDLHDTTLLGVARLCPLLTDLDVSHCHRVTDFSIKAVAAACTALTRIDISQCALITDVSLISLANHCHELLILRVAFCRHITDISLIEASIGCPLLRDLDVDHCDLLSEEGLATFVGNNWGHLRRFSLRCVRNHLTETDDCALNEIGQQCSRLEALSISGRGFKLGGFIADMVANCLALRELRVVFVKELCDADVLRMVSSCRHLISFSLEHCSRITDVGATYVLRNCLLLRSLCVKGSAISVATLDALATGVCPSTKNLRFHLFGAFAMENTVPPSNRFLNAKRREELFSEMVAGCSALNSLTLADAIYNMNNATSNSSAHNSSSNINFDALINTASSTPRQVDPPSSHSALITTPAPSFSVASLGGLSPPAATLARPASAGSTHSKSVHRSKKTPASAVNILSPPQPAVALTLTTTVGNSSSSTAEPGASISAMIASAGAGTSSVPLLAQVIAATTSGGSIPNRMVPSTTTVAQSIPQSSHVAPPLGLPYVQTGNGSDPFGFQYIGGGFYPTYQQPNTQYPPPAFQMTSGFGLFNANQASSDSSNVFGGGNIVSVAGSGGESSELESQQRKNEFNRRVLDPSRFSHNSPPSFSSGISNSVAQLPRIDRLASNGTAEIVLRPDEFEQYQQFLRFQQYFAQQSRKLPPISQYHQSYEMAAMPQYEPFLCPPTFDAQNRVTSSAPP